MKIFVTVGTTEFDELIKIISNFNFINNVQKQGYTSMTIQKGKGTFQLNIKEYNNIFPNFELKVFDFDSSLDLYMKEADLIISHGGAGCLFEGLHLKKKVVAVLNESLMGNHQLELVSALSNLNYVIKTNTNEIEKLFEKELPSLDEYKLPDRSQIANSILELGI
eukprot:gene10356-2770_t